MKKVIWAATARVDLKSLPEDVQDEVGFILYLVQKDLRHPSIKVLRGFRGATVQEIKVNDSAGTYRAIYTVKFKDYLYVLHVFQKKSMSGSRTPLSDIELVNKRLKWAE